MNKNITTTKQEEPQVQTNYVQDAFDLFDRIWAMAEKKGEPMSLRKATKFVKHLSSNKK